MGHVMSLSKRPRSPARQSASLWLFPCNAASAYAWHGIHAALVCPPFSSRQSQSKHLIEQKAGRCAWPYRRISIHPQRSRVSDPMATCRQLTDGPSSQIRGTIAASLLVVALCPDLCSWGPVLRSIWKSTVPPPSRLVRVWLWSRPAQESPLSTRSIPEPPDRPQLHQESRT